MILRFDSTALRDAFVERLDREHRGSPAVLAAKNLPDVIVGAVDPDERERLVALAAEYSGRAYSEVAFDPFGEPPRG